MQIIYVSFQKTLRVTETDHRGIEYYHIQIVSVNPPALLDVKNFENMLVELLVGGSAEISGTFVKLIEVNLLVLNGTQFVHIVVN